VVEGHTLGPRLDAGAWVTTTSEQERDEFDSWHPVWRWAIHGCLAPAPGYEVPVQQQGYPQQPRGFLQHSHNRPQQQQHGSPGTADQMGQFARRNLRTPETKPFFFASEFYVWLATVIGVIITCAVAADFGSNQAAAIVAAVSIGYMVSRGLAKAGSRRSEPEDR
jgi:hypothetical protein